MPDLALHPDSPAGRLAAAVLDAAEDTAALRRPAEGGTLARPSFARLMQYATAPLAAADPDLDRALARDADLAADFRRLLANTARHHFALAAAASSGKLEQRRAGAARMFLRPSRAADDQVYLIVELDPGEAPPRLLFALGPGGAVERVTLPAFSGGRAQLLLDKSAALVQAFQDVNAEFYVK